MASPFDRGLQCNVASPSNKGTADSRLLVQRLTFNCKDDLVGDSITADSITALVHPSSIEYDGDLRAEISSHHITLILCLFIQPGNVYWWSIAKTFNC